MIRDVVLHLGNEQPLIVDLFETPTPSDVSVICTNVRTMTGTKPIWIDHGASIFFFPLAIIRFIEIHSGAEEALGLVVEAGAVRGSGEPGAAATTEPDLEIDEEFLRRVRDI